jgi:hypothetical protein
MTIKFILADMSIFRCEIKVRKGIFKNAKPSFILVFRHALNTQIKAV